jgi:Zn-finger nucleic acid-binding protein
MNRRNYGSTSGVIIDLCREHGIWFDADELARILTWVRAGGAEKSRREKSAAAAEAEAELRAQTALERPHNFLTRILDFLFGPGGRW